MWTETSRTGGRGVRRRLYLDPGVVQSVSDGQSLPVGETTSLHVSSCHEPAFLPPLRPRSPLVLLQQLADELLGELAGVTEELLIKLVVYGGNVLQGVVFGLPQEGRSSAQPGTKHTHVSTTETQTTAGTGNLSVKT